VRPSPPLYDTVRQGRCQLCDTVPPTLVRSTLRTLERGRQNPRKGDERLFHACPGPRRDVGPVRRVSSVTICPARPSPPSRRHPGHCSAIPDAVGARGDKTPPRPRLCPLRPPVSCTLESVWTTTEREAPMPPPSKPLLGAYMARRDAPPEARFARTAVYSATLYTIPSRVARIVRHACRLPPPWPIKGGQSLCRRRKNDRQHSPTRFLPSPRYWHSPQSKPQGPGGSTSPASLVAALCKHHGATQYNASSTSLLDVRPRPEPG
jgi:hypothetical protein